MQLFWLVIGLTAYLALAIVGSIYLDWQSDVIGGLVTLPVEIVFVAALVAKLQSDRERKEWQPSRELLIANTRELYTFALSQLSNLELVFTTDVVSRIPAERRRDYAARYIEALKRQSRDWILQHDTWLQDMQLSSACLNPALIRCMVAFNQSITAFTTLYQHLIAVADGVEKEAQLGAIHPKVAAWIWDRFQGMNDAFEVLGVETMSPAVKNAIDGWSVCTALLGLMYEEVGYERSRDDESDPERLVYTRGEEEHYFVLIGFGFKTSLTSIEKGLRMLRN